MDSCDLTHFLLGINQVKSRFTFPSQKVFLLESLSHVGIQKRERLMYSHGVR